MTVHETDPMEKQYRESLLESLIDLPLTSLSNINFVYNATKISEKS